jgi:hypothetical protein
MFPALRGLIAAQLYLPCDKTALAPTPSPRFATFSRQSVVFGNPNFIQTVAPNSLLPGPTRHIFERLDEIVETRRWIVVRKDRAVMRVSFVEGCRSTACR